MSGENSGQVEVTFRLPQEGLAQLTELLTGLLAAARGDRQAEVATETQESGSFDPERFQTLMEESAVSAESEMTMPEEPLPAAETIWKELSLPEHDSGELEELPELAKVEYNPSMDADVFQAERKETERVETQISTRPTGTEKIFHRMERDARRYDSGFPIY